MSFSSKRVGGSFAHKASEASNKPGKGFGGGKGLGKGRGKGAGGGGGGGGSTLLNGLVAWWDFEEGSGTTATDSVNGYTVSDSVQQWATGKTGSSAINYNGGSSAPGTAMSNVPAIAVSGSFSVCFWAYTNTYATNRFYGHANTRWFIGIENTTKKLRFGKYYNGGSQAMAHATATMDPTSTWYFVAAVYDADAATLSLSKDNGTVSTLGSITPGYPTTSGDFVLNASQLACCYHIGKVDAFGIWDRALTAAEITEVYNSGNGLSYADL